MGLSVGHHYICKVTVNGKELNMMIDTGASATVIDQNIFHKLKNKYPIVTTGAKSAGFGGSQNLSQVTIINNIKFNGINFKKHVTSVIDCSHMFSIYPVYGINEKVDGVLGMDILSYTQSVIDFKKEIIKSDIPSAKVRRQLKKLLDYSEPLLKEYKKYFKSKTVPTPAKQEEVMNFISPPEEPDLDIRGTTDGLPGTLTSSGNN